MVALWLCDGHNASVSIDRNNSFHLLLSDDELKLLRLLAEREGLNASDYLRMLLRQMAGAPPHLMQLVRLGAALGGKASLAEIFESHAAAAKGKAKKPKKPKKPKKTKNK